jgi:dethiobiotin synthetase
VSAAPLRGVFVAGTDTGIGKTRVTAGLIRALRAMQLRAIGMKPIASGAMTVDGMRSNQDAVTIAEVSTPGAPLSDINPYCLNLPVSPHIAAERDGIVIDLEHIARAYDRLTGRCDVVVVEGTGGWLAPIGPDMTMADVACRLRLPVVLVVGLRLGCLNHALLTAHAIESAGASLIGWIGSVIDADMAALHENLQTLTQRLPAASWALLPYAPGSEHDADALEPAARALRAVRLP